MSRKIKVKKSLAPMSIPDRIERNDHVASKLSSFSVLTDLPHTPAEITSQTGKVSSFYGLHLGGDKEATAKMYLHADIMDEYYYDTAEYVEKIANQTNDSTLPTGVGLELYTERSARAKKTYSVADGEHLGEIIFEYPVIKNASAYVIQIAEEIPDKDAVFNYVDACSITTYLIKGMKSKTRYLLRVAGVFPEGTRAYCDPIPFTTKDWKYPD
jgi:hypothetical protein